MGRAPGNWIQRCRCYCCCRCCAVAESYSLLPSQAGRPGRQPSAACQTGEPGLVMGSRMGRARGWAGPASLPTLEIPPSGRYSRWIQSCADQLRVLWLVVGDRARGRERNKGHLMLLLVLLLLIKLTWA